MLMTTVFSLFLLNQGFGFVTFSNDTEAEKAIAEMNETELDGRRIKVK